MILNYEKSKIKPNEKKKNQQIYKKKKIEKWKYFYCKIYL